MQKTYLSPQLLLLKSCIFVVLQSPRARSSVAPTELPSAASAQALGVSGPAGARDVEMKGDVGLKESNEYIVPSGTQTLENELFIGDFSQL